jgi:hypothetical protein
MKRMAGWVLVVGVGSIATAASAVWVFVAGLLIVVPVALWALVALGVSMIEATTDGPAEERPTLRVVK